MWRNGFSATEGFGLQSILSDLDLCGHVVIKSDATAAIGMVHRFGLGKVRHFGCGRFMGVASWFVGKVGIGESQ